MIDLVIEHDIIPSTVWGVFFFLTINAVISLIIHSMKNGTFDDCEFSLNIQRKTTF